MEVPMKNNLADIRIQRGMSQKMLAETVKTDQAVISRIENGQDNLQFDTAKKLALALGVAVIDIFPELASSERASQ